MARKVTTRFRERSVIHLIMLGGGAASATHAVFKGCSVLVTWGFVLTSGAGVGLADADAMGPEVILDLGWPLFAGGCIGRTIFDLFEEAFDGNSRIPLGLHLVFVGTEVFGGDIYISGVEMGDEGASADEGKAM